MGIYPFFRLSDLKGRTDTLWKGGLLSSGYVDVSGTILRANSIEKNIQAYYIHSKNRLVIPLKSLIGHTNKYTSKVEFIEGVKYNKMLIYLKNRLSVYTMDKKNEVLAVDTVKDLGECSKI